MRKIFTGWRLILAISVFVIILAYAAVPTVQANHSEPGSSQDPLVSKSYVDNYFRSHIRELQERIENLNRQIAALEARIGVLEGNPKPSPQPSVPSLTPPPAAEGEIKLVVGHQTARLGGTTQKLQAAPYLSSGNTTMVPFRFIGEALGAEVNFDSDAKTVSYTTPNHSVILKIGSQRGTIDGRAVDFSAPAVLVNNITMVPVRVISEGLGARVAWDQPTGTITIRP